MSNHKGRYRAPRKPRNPFYLLAALAVGMLLLVGACADTDDGAPDSFPVNAERRSGDADTAPEPVVDEPEPEVDPLSDEEITRIAMEMTFDESSATELAEICDGIDLYGMDVAVAFFADGWGPSWEDSYGPILADVLNEKC